MGIFDHRKTWTFKVKATPADCLAAFGQALANMPWYSPHKVQWKFERLKSTEGNDKLVATLQGRSHLAAFLTPFFGRQAEITGQNMIGSALSMEIVGHDPDTGTTTCALWMSSVNTEMGVFVSGAGTHRKHMNRVARQLARLSPNMSVEKE